MKKKADGGTRRAQTAGSRMRNAASLPHERDESTDAGVPRNRYQA